MSAELLLVCFAPARSIKYLRLLSKVIVVVRDVVTSWRDPTHPPVPLSSLFLHFH